MQAVDGLCRLLEVRELSEHSQIPSNERPPSTESHGGLSFLSSEPGTPGARRDREFFEIDGKTAGSVATPGPTRAGPRRGCRAKDGARSSEVERPVVIRLVAGSIPVVHPKIRRWRSLVAHQSGGLGVAGSNPARLTKFIEPVRGTFRF